MPSVSKKQHNFMAMVANSPKMAKQIGIKQSVGKDFLAADKGKKFKKGGDIMAKCGGKVKKMADGGVSDMDIEPDMGSISPKKPAPKPKKYARGGGIEIRGKTKGRMI